MIHITLHITLNDPCRYSIRISVTYILVTLYHPSPSESLGEGATALLDLVYEENEYYFRLV